jgi:glycosyltransferase involved in cell wall biosynthesis
VKPPEADIPYQDVTRIGDFEAIARSGLFDMEFYLARARERHLYEPGRHPIEHYVAKGEALGIPPNPLFDPEYYRSRYPDIASARLSALVHYLTHGDAEGRVPHPLFDPTLVREQLGPDFPGNTLARYLASRGGELRPHRLFDPAYVWERQQRLAPADARPSLVFYLARKEFEPNPSPRFDNYSYKMMYPEIGELNPLYHYARHGFASGYSATRPKNSLRGITEQIDEAAGIEPDVVSPFGARTALPVMELYDTGRIEYRLAKRLASRSGAKRYAHVVLAPWLKRGGAERVIANWVEAISARDPDAAILIVCTQGGDAEGVSWLPYARQADVLFIHDVIDGSDGVLVTVANGLRFFGCRTLYVVNSAFGWDLIIKCGQSLRALMGIVGFVFCHDYDEFGRRAGYAWTHLRKALPHGDAFVTDNFAAIELFCREHFFDAGDRAKFHCLYQPVDSALARAAPLNLDGGERRRRAVLWAARFDRQKGLELALEIARGLPEVDFVIYGGEAEDMPRASADPPGNVSVRGAFDRFGDLPLHEMSLFLHTSHWDGLPNVLLEAGAAGLPVVATLVGGVGELIDEGTGWPVAHGAGASAYIERIARILAAPAEAIARAGCLSRRIAERHSAEGFARQVSELLEGVALAPERRAR